MTTIQEALRDAANMLRPTSPTARLDVEMILAHVLKSTRERLLADWSEALRADDHRRFLQLLERRVAGEPVAYLIGEREFYGLRMHVDRRVLVPRPETELLVEHALRLARVHPRYPTRVLAVDCSVDALAVARANVQQHHLADRVTLLHGMDFAPLDGPVDLLLTNPPYTILAEVDENVRRFEPAVALDGGADGLEMIERLLRSAPAYLQTGAMLVEIGAWQGQAALTLARACFPDALIRLHVDLAGLDRLLEIRAGF
jgi:release factor glutamine methyltransferase